MKPILLRAAALSALLLLVGCNKLRLGYEYADWLVIYSVEDNFDLEKSQRTHLKEDVSAYFHWHRKGMLPQYADLLAAVADSLKVGLRPEGIDSGYRQYWTLYRKTMEPVVEPALNLLMSLDKDQIDGWAEKQRKKNDKHRRDFAGSRDDLLERRYQKTLDELEDWTGRLSNDQRKQLRDWSRALPWNADLWLVSREKIQAHLLDLLRTKASKEELRKFLSDYFMYPENLRTPEFNTAYRAYELRVKDMIVHLYAILTDDQKRHFVSEIERLVQQMRTMSRQD